MNFPQLVTGQRVGRLVLIEPDAARRYYWRCQCDCGVVNSIKGSNLKAGKSKSCRCSKRTHGHATDSDATYNSWRGMKHRCGKGTYADITYIAEWESFDKFLLDMGPAPESMTLDRINPCRGYYKANCRWASRETQEANKRQTDIIYSRFGRGTVAQCAKFLRKLTNNAEWNTRTLRVCLKAMTLDQIIVAVHPNTISARELEERNADAKKLEKQKEFDDYFRKLMDGYCEYKPGGYPENIERWDFPS